MAFARYGLTPRPGADDGPPLQFVVAGDGAWHMSCFACHGGQVAGRTFPVCPMPISPSRRSSTSRGPRGGCWDARRGSADLTASLIPFGETVGTTNAVVFSIALLQWRDRD